MRNAVIVLLLAIALTLFFGFDNSRPVSLREEEEEQDTIPVTKTARDSAGKHIETGLIDTALH